MKFYPAAPAAANSPKAYDCSQRPAPICLHCLHLRRSRQQCRNLGQGRRIFRQRIACTRIMQRPELHFPSVHCPCNPQKRQTL